MRIARMPLWTYALALVIAYVTLITDDAYVARIPLKLFMVGGTMVVWWWQVGRERSLRDYEFAPAVLLFAIAIPIVWSLVAAAQKIGGDSAGLHSFSWTAQEASRFVYLLLYFPLLDALRLYGRDGVYFWLAPIFLLCGVTVALFFCHYLTGSPTDGMGFLVFKGVFQGNAGGFRVFIGNQVLFVAGVAFLLSELAAHGASRLRSGGLALLIFSAYLSHTRGIWLALSVVSAGIVLVLFWRELDAGRRRALLIAAGAFVALVVAAGIAMLAGFLPRPSFLGDASAGSRVEQAPKLWDAFKRNPIFGDGLGSVIRPRFVRDTAAPWSYELTYLQILFQMGIVGLFALLALPVAACWRGLKASVDGRLDPGPLAGVMTILGILIASATNPYLMSSFGMLGIAIGLSLVARAEPLAGT